MSLEIKRLTKKDFALAKDMFTQFLNADETVSDDKHLLRLLGKKSFYGIVALQENKIVGRLTAYEFEKYHDNSREVYLYEVDVDEAFQNQGIGSKLVEFAKKICKKRGVDYMFVGTEADNLPAQRLYDKTGICRIMNMILKENRFVIFTSLYLYVNFLSKHSFILRGTKIHAS
jgi:ribosomal protein S18 acetylase RimI-like enzyme